MSMEPIRTKDKIFVLIVGTAAVLAAYCHFWRQPTARRAEQFERESASLVEEADYPAERARAEKALAVAKAECEAERQKPIPAAQVVAKAEEPIAARERCVLEVFRHAGLIVRESAPVEGEGGEALKATGTRPAPICRTYALDGTYPAFLAALRRFAERKMAVVPVSVALPKPNTWRITLWL